jgi:hypothetical protein
MRLESCQPAINVVSAPPSYYSVRLAVGQTSVRASSSDARRQSGVAARRSNISTLPTRILLSVATQSGCGFAKIAIGALHFCGSPRLGIDCGGRPRVTSCPRSHPVQHMLDDRFEMGEPRAATRFALKTNWSSTDRSWPRRWTGWRAAVTLAIEGAES